MIDDDFKELQKDLAELKTVKQDVAYLASQLSYGKDVVMHDTLNMIEDIGFMIRQVLWFLFIAFVLLGAFVVYVFIGWIVNFVLRIRTAWRMIMIDGHHTQDADLAI